MESRIQKGFLFSALASLCVLSTPCFAANTATSNAAPTAVDKLVDSDAMADADTSHVSKQLEDTRLKLPATSTAVALPPPAADPGDLTPPVNTSYDPYSAINRPIFWFNDKFDTYFFKPVATFYNKIMPKPLNKGIHNVYINIGNLPNIANDVLQLHWYQGLNDFWRLSINSTVGIGGVFDIAERMNLQPYQNDFGLTMARWGWRNSNYLTFPFLGPSTPRDTIGFFVDYFAFSIYPYIDPQSLRYQTYALGALDRRAQLLKYEDVVEAVSIDEYVFLRSAYMQNRDHRIEENLEKGFLTKYRSDISKEKQEGNS